jgi:hypothetical protein
MAKCKKCGKEKKPQELEETLWQGGPNGNRKYQLCAGCRKAVAGAAKPITVEGKK